MLVRFLVERDSRRSHRETDFMNTERRWNRIESRVSFTISFVAFLISVTTFYFSTFYVRQDVVVRLTEHDTRMYSQQSQDLYSLFTFTVSNVGTKPVALTHVAAGLWIPDIRQKGGFTVGEWSPVYLGESLPPVSEYVVKPTLLMPGEIKIIVTANDLAPFSMFKNESYSAVTKISNGLQIIEGLMLEFETNDGNLVKSAFPVRYTLKMANSESYVIHDISAPYHALSVGIVHPIVVDYLHLPKTSKEFWE
jgi:hypothetical protein